MADEELEMHDEHEEQADAGVENNADDNGSDEDAQAAASSSEDLVASSTSSDRENLRKSMEDDVAAFLAKGGQIQQVEDNVMADPPRKPQSSYGSRPI